MYSYVIIIAIIVSNAIEESNTIPTFGLNIDIAKKLIVDPGPNKISVIINFTFFLFMG